MKLSDGLLSSQAAIVAVGIAACGVEPISPGDSTLMVERQEDWAKRQEEIRKDKSYPLSDDTHGVSPPVMKFESVESNNASTGEMRVVIRTDGVRAATRAGLVTEINVYSNTLLHRTAGTLEPLDLLGDVCGGEFAPDKRTKQLYIKDILIDDGPHTFILPGNPDDVEAVMQTHTKLRRAARTAMRTEQDIFAARGNCEPDDSCEPVIRLQELYRAQLASAGIDGRGFYPTPETTMEDAQRAEAHSLGCYSRLPATHAEANDPNDRYDGSFPDAQKRGRENDGKRGNNLPRKQRPPRGYPDIRKELRIKIRGGKPPNR